MAGQGNFFQVSGVGGIVQLVQTALDFSALHAVDLHGKGKERFGRPAVGTPFQMLRGVPQQGVALPFAICSVRAGQPQKGLFHAVRALGRRPEQVGVILKIALVVGGVLLHDRLQRRDHVHVFKLVHSAASLSLGLAALASCLGAGASNLALIDCLRAGGCLAGRSRASSLWTNRYRPEWLGRWDSCLPLPR